MSKAVVSMSIYFILLFLATFLIPLDMNESIDTSILNITTSDVSSDAWDLGDNIGIFISFFSFSIINPLGMPSELGVILSLINVLFAVILLYGIMVLIRGGGSI